MPPPLKRQCFNVVIQLEHDPSLRLSPGEPLMSSSRSDESSPASKRRVGSLEKGSLMAAFGGLLGRWMVVELQPFQHLSALMSEQGRRSHGVLVALNCGRGSSIVALNWRRNSSFVVALWSRRRHDLFVGLSLGVLCRRSRCDIWAEGKACEFRDDTCSRR